MNDDLERLISDSLDARGAALGSADAGIDAVYDRVGRRRLRRRAVAATGSVALVAVGVVAIAALGDDDGLTPAASPAAASAEGAGGWAEYLPAGSPVWQCSGHVVYDDADGNSYWADCTSVTLPEDAGVIPAYDAVPTTVTYSGDCWVTTSAPGEPYTTSTPCEIAPATTAPCELVPTTTTIPMTIAPDATWATTEAARAAAEAECFDPAPMATTTMPADDFATTTTTIMCVREGGSTTTTLDCGIEHRVAVQQLYTVLAGDSHTSIADRFGITTRQLIDYNAWDDGDDHLLLPGEEVLIPPGALVPSD